MYLAAGTPSLDEIAADIEAVESLKGVPSRDTVHRCISKPALPANQADAAAVAFVLARRAAWDEYDLRAQICGLWVAAQMAKGAGRPISEFSAESVLSNLGVHPALDAGVVVPELRALPAYVPRDFDTQLGEVVAAAVAGSSRIAVLVGDSFTGKTRSSWEAVRSLPEGWRLWHPISPSRPAAALAELADVAPRSVVWLNEAQEFLAPSKAGEEIAAGLHDLLRDPDRAPVLVLATLWSRYWDELTTRSEPDRCAAARELLRGHRIDVPDSFTRDELDALAGKVAVDARLGEADERAEDGRITQYLAGVAVLKDRYENASGVTKELIHAAMDVRRLGGGPNIPLSLLISAAPGYLREAEWNLTPEDWEARALAYVMAPVDGIPGILTPVKTGTVRNHRNRRDLTPTSESPRPGHRRHAFLTLRRLDPKAQPPA
ncbi:hypothetical protein [Streptacidiphilus sp. PAMC 29251]